MVLSFQHQPLRVQTTLQREISSDRIDPSVFWATQSTTPYLVIAGLDPAIHNAADKGVTIDVTRNLRMTRNGLPGQARQ